MNFHLRYILENIRLKYWNFFLNKCVKDISMILSQDESNEIITYKLEQKILYYITYLIGICDPSTYVFFVKTACIIDNQHIFKEDMLHNWKITDRDFDKIIFILIKYNSISKKEIKKEFSLIQKSSRNTYLKKIIKDQQVIFNIKSDLFSSTFKISLTNYSRLEKMFKGDHLELDKYVCLLLTRYNFYGYLKEGICLSADIVYDFIKKQNLIDKTLEAFAGTLNSNLPNYCSLFYDLEGKFGSKGSFLQIDPRTNNCMYKCIISNPPYFTNVMNKSSEILLGYLDVCRDLNVIVVIPDWRSITEYESDKQIQISINEHTQERQLISYNAYDILRKSKYFAKVIVIGNYSYYNFFGSSHKKIRDNSLFIVLSLNHKTDFINLFTNFIEKKLKS